MPEMRFFVRWPDGECEACYSPSLVIKDHLAVGESYALDEFVLRSRTALLVASERVKARYGMPCSLALAQLARIEARGNIFSDTPHARVAVDAFEE